MIHNGSESANPGLLSVERSHVCTIPSMAHKVLQSIVVPAILAYGVEGMPQRVETEAGPLEAKFLQDFGEFLRDRIPVSPVRPATTVFGNEDEALMLGNLSVQAVLPSTP